MSNEAASDTPVDDEDSRAGEVVSEGADDALKEEVSPAVEAKIEELVMERYRSQFPHPDHLREYANLYPRAPEIIFEQFERQSDHRRVSERTYMVGNERRADRGQWLAYSLVVFGIAAGVLAILVGQAAVGATIVTVVFGGGVVLYIAGGGVSRVAPARQNRRSETDRARARTGTIATNPAATEQS